MRRRSLPPMVLLAALACTADSTQAPSDVPSVLAPVTLIGAGDMHSKCRAQHPSNATAALLQNFPGALVFAGGDNAGNMATAAEYECYDLNWGKFKSRTIPVIGNHELNYDPLAVGYYDYFNGKGVDSGAAGRRGRGYYLLNYGGWRIFIGNSQQHQSDQTSWIARDLAANPTRCTMAILHRPLFTSSAKTKPFPRVSSIWKALYDGGADVILGGHSHQYERFAKTRWDGTRDATRGIRHFVVGTGGGVEYPFTSPPHPASQVRISTHGVLKLTLWPDRYAWQFIGLTGQILDSGSEACH